MTKFRTFIFLLIMLTTTAAFAQERDKRTWITVGVVGMKSNVGLRICGAYDLRYGFQARGCGELLNKPVIPRLLTGNDNAARITGELRAGAALLYHVRREGLIKPFGGAGIESTRHFFQWTGLPGRSLYYYSAVNPVIVAGAGLGNQNEIFYTRFLSDTYGYSRLRGNGIEWNHTRRINGPLNLRVGVRLRRWAFRYNGRVNEASATVGVLFQ